MKSKRGISSLAVVVIIFVLLAGGGGGYLFGLKGQQAPVPAPTPSPTEIYATSTYLYIEEFGNVPNVDQKIVGIRRNGEHVVWIESVRNEIGLGSSEILKQIAAIPERQKLIFLRTEYGTESSIDEIWEFNGWDNTLRRMNLSEQYSGSGTLVVSPNQKLAAHIGSKSKNDKIILLDFVADTARELAEIGGSQTGPNGSSIERGFKLEWIDNNAIEFGVYDGTNSFEDSGVVMHPYIGKRRVFADLPCADSDGGDIYTKGTLEGPKLVNGNKPVDYCVSYEEEVLVEYSCKREDKDGHTYNQNSFGIYSNSVKCPLGCSDGACIRPSPSPSPSPTGSVKPSPSITPTPLPTATPSVIPSPSVSDAAKQRDARRITDIKQLQLALELYFDGQGSGQYPPATEVCDAEHSYGLEVLVSRGYIPRLSRDPLTGACYKFATRQSGNTTTYHIGAVLELANSPALTSDKNCRSDGLAPVCSAGTWINGFDGASPQVYDVMP